MAGRPVGRFAPILSLHVITRCRPRVPGDLAERRFPHFQYPLTVAQSRLPLGQLPLTGAGGDVCLHPAIRLVPGPRPGLGPMGQHPGFV